MIGSGIERLRLLVDSVPIAFAERGADGRRPPGRAAAATRPASATPARTTKIGTAHNSGDAGARRTHSP